jgi:hypothetical protein
MHVSRRGTLSDYIVGRAPTNVVTDDDCFLGYRWPYSGFTVMQILLHDLTMMQWARTALGDAEPHASCRTAMLLTGRL